jgi:hypothetical protein
MPDAQFEIIRLEDIGKDVIKSSSSKKPNNRSTYKLSDADVENLKHYLNRYNQPSSKITPNKKIPPQKSSLDITKQIINSSSHRHHHHHQQHGYVDITDDFYSDKLYSDLRESSQPLTDIYRYHHHYRRHHQHTKHDHEKPTVPILSGDYQVLSLDFATCGMKKNTRLPVPNENFSLINGSFGDDAGFTLRCNEQNFLGMFFI